MNFTYQEKLVFLLIFIFSGIDFFFRSGNGFDVFLCNHGIGWGIRAPQEWIFVISPLTLIGVSWYWWKSEHWRIRVACCLIFFGGVMNLMDRIIFGCVRDYLQLPLFPSFNMADMMLCLGVGLLFFFLFVRPEHQE